jgi:3',5'-cyclic AMP phosphodiesterase CpdA
VVVAFRFLFMADCQLGCYATFSGLDDDDVERYAERDLRVVATPRTQGFDWDARQYERAIAAANLLRPDLVVMGGDMVDDPADVEQRAEVRRITTRLDGIPMHWVPGNHDIGEDTVVPTEASVASYRAGFGPDHYAFEHEGTTFIVTDTVVWDHPEKVPREWDRQLATLEEQLRAARGSRHTLVFGHHPLFTVSPDEPDTYWNIPTERRRIVLDLLKGHGVRAYFCGHWHRNGGGWDGELEIAVTGPVGYPLGTDPSGFRIVDVHDDRVEHVYVGLDEVGVVS